MDIVYGLLIMLICFGYGFYVSYSMFTSNANEIIAAQIIHFESIHLDKMGSLNYQIKNLRAEREDFELNKKEILSDLEQKLAVSNKEYQELKEYYLTLLQKLQKSDKRNSRLQHELFCARKRMKTLGSNKK